MFNLKPKKKELIKPIKKQVLLRTVDEVDLYHKVKGKMQMQQSTFSDWLVTQMREEMYGTNEN